MSLDLAQSTYRRFLSFLFSEVENSGIVIWRILFGFLLTAEAWGAVLTGWIKETFIDPEFRFTFIGFEFLQALGGEWMYLYSFVMGVFGLMIMFGAYYRIGTIGYFLMWAGIYFGQKSHYNNHYYLMLLLVGLMFFIPANTYASLDVRRRPGIKKMSVPRWSYFIFMLQFGIVYFYATVAKLYPDWLLAKPVSLWLRSKSDYWLIGPILEKDITHWLFSYGGIFYDGAIIPLLIFKRTRKAALVLSLVFHLTNSAVFHIGVFPFLAISVIVIFWDPDQLRRLFFRDKPRHIPVVGTPSITAKHKFFLTLFALYFAWQIYLPLRHHYYDGNVHWTEEGHRLSWQMMTRAKYGTGHFEVRGKNSSKPITVFPEKYLEPHQVRSMVKRPDMIWQFARYLKEEHEGMGIDSVEVYAKTRIGLNGRKRQPLIDPDFDLASVKKWERFKSKPWITELRDNWP